MVVSGSKVKSFQSHMAHSARLSSFANTLVQDQNCWSPFP